jgi:hypothetical protein
MKRAAFIVSFIVATAALAKAPTTKIVVDGGGLKTPIDIVAPQILQQSNVWLGAMLDQSTPAFSDAPAAGPRFRLQFFANFGRGEEKVYTMLYQPNAHGAGYLFLPFDARNRGSIIRDGRDGKWSYAARDWEALVKPVILRAAR